VGVRVCPTRTSSAALFSCRQILSFSKAGFFDTDVSLELIGSAMPFAAALSNRPNLTSAIEEATRSIKSALHGAKPDLTIVFVSHHFATRFAELAEVLQEALSTRVLLGCTAEAVVGGARECEDEPALSIWCGVLPGATLTTFELAFEETPDGMLCSGLPDNLGEACNETRAVLVLGEPFTSLPQSILELLRDELPGVPVVGGMASGGGPGENRLFLVGRMIESGAIGVVLRGGPHIRTIVSQGCRPIGTPFVVTRAERNVIYELGGVPPLQRLQTLYPELPPRDQKLVETGVHLGVVMNEYQDHFQRGDFLIVNVHGADRHTGALATGGLMRVGQTVQFHIRDAATADEDLCHLLDRHRANSPAGSRAALLFTCNGRGTRMFPAPNHDAAAVQQHLGPLPLAGLFAQGELGPVGDKNYIHGFTASIAVFEEG
jgi:small ligand-binding sensory domain FIST